MGAPQYTVNCSILFTELPLLERPAAAKAAGFDAIEVWWPFSASVPSSSEVDTFVAAVENADVQLTGLNFAAGDMPAGDRGLVSWTGRESEFAENAALTAEIGKRLGCRAFNALYGLRQPDLAAEEQDETAVANLAVAADAVGGIGGVVLVEPVSGAPAYPIVTAVDALTAIDRVGAETGAGNLKLLADLYHLAVNGDDVDEVIASHLRRIGHVQIADAPGRNEPETGDLPLMRQIGALLDGGYDGFIGLEYKPSGRSEDSFAWIDRTEQDA